MVRFLSQLFNIRRDEWMRLLWLYAILVASLTGVGWGERIVEAAFLLQVGVAYLPLIIMGNAVLSIGAIILYTAFADRVSNDRLLIAIVSASAVGVLLGLFLLAQGWVTLAFPLLYLIVNVNLRYMLAVHWATYVNGFYDTRAAKRVVPVLGSGARVAGIIGGLTLPLLNNLLAPSGIIGLWLVMLLVMISLVWLMPRVLDTGHPGAVRLQGALFDWKHSRDNIVEGYRYVASMSFLRWVGLSTFAMMLLIAFLNYQASKAMLLELNTVQQLSNFTGLLDGLSNLVALPFQLFLFSRLISRIGLGNTTLIFPLTTSAASAGLIAAPGLVTGGFGYLDRTTLRTSVQSSVDGLLFNTVPLRVKARARAFINGFIVPIGSFCGGLLLIGLQSVPGSWYLVLMGLIAAMIMVYLVSAWQVRQKYAQALIAMLKQEDYASLFSTEASDLTVTDSRTLNWLREKLHQPDATPEFTVFMAQLITQVSGNEGVPMLMQAARASTDPHVRAQIAQVLAAAGMRGNAVRELCTELLADENGDVRQAALAGLEQVSTPDELEPHATRLLQDRDPAVRVQALLALTPSRNFNSITPAVNMLEQLLTDPDPARRAEGVRALGQTRTDRAKTSPLPRLIEFLGDPADQVRLQAALALENVTISNMPPLVFERVDDLLTDSVERVRQAAITMLGNAGTLDAQERLVRALLDCSPRIRVAAVEMLARAGRSVVPVVQPLLDSPEPQRRKMATVVLARVHPREYAPRVMGTEIAGNLQTIYRNEGYLDALAPLAVYPGFAIMRDALKEQNQQTLDEVFYLLSVVCPPAAVSTIHVSFRSEEAHIRANAAEALETLTNPQLARWIAPLYEPSQDRAEMRRLSETAWNLRHPDTRGLINQLCGAPDSWQRTMMAFALRELCASPDPSAAAPGEPLTRSEIEALLQTLSADAVEDVRLAAAPTAQTQAPSSKEAPLLSTIEKIIFLKQVPFFQGMTIEQLRVLANVCEEEFFSADASLFKEGDPGGVLYVVVSGRVALEQEKRKGAVARLGTIEAHSYVGETNLFDNSPRTNSAHAIQDTLTLRLRREPLVALARQHPDMSLELINVLSVRLREANDRIVDLTRTKPKELHKLLDQL